MAGLDYGVMVFRDGTQIYENELYPSVIVDDDRLQISCYKVWCEIKCACDSASYFKTEIAGNYPYGNAKSVWFTCGKFRFHIDEVCESVFRLRFNAENSHYTVIYGYGIDNDMKIWNKIKVRYLGKFRARAVDRAIQRALGGA